jgi:hypothetical protein
MKECSTSSGAGLERLCTHDWMCSTADADGVEFLEAWFQGCAWQKHRHLSENFLAAFTRISAAPGIMGHTLTLAAEADRPKAPGAAGHPLPCWQAQPFPDVLDDPFDQARQVRSGFNRFDPSSLVMGGSPDFPGSRGLLPTCALLCFDEFVANQGGVQHAMLPFVLEVVGSNPVLLRMVPLDHPARVSSLRPVCLEQGRQTTANP